jgi:hypothetical protein
MIPHPFGIGGLVANMIATVMLLKFPPDLKGYLPDGSNVGGTFAELPTPEGKRRFRRLQDGYKLALALLFLGFFLQALDLLINK